MIAVLQIRGTIDAKQTVKDTLMMLSLGRKMSVVLVDGDSPAMMGMVRKCKDFITYGEVSDETVKTIKKIQGDQKAARLHPPRGGMKSVKRAVNQGGDLGKREDMDALIARMLPEELL